LNSNIIKLKVSDYPIQNGRIDKWIIEALSLLHSSYPGDLKVNTFFSRTKIKDLILSGNIKVDGIKNINPAYKINPKNEIIINLPEVVEYDLKAENIPINIVFEDEHLLVINKEPNFVVHPSPGHNSGTLVNAILYHCDSKLSGIGGIKRPGIVHRLDKDTSGLMVVAKNEKALLDLSNQISNRTVSRIYDAFVVGNLKKSGKIDLAIGRHPNNRQKQAIQSNGREAITYYSLKENFGNYSHLELKLETGRTHQIRVHLSHTGFPIIGDPLYGRKRRFAKSTNSELREIIELFPRQALHASKLSFKHPSTKKTVNFVSELPEDMRSLKDKLAQLA